MSRRKEPIVDTARHRQHGPYRTFPHSGTMPGTTAYVLGNGPTLPPLEDLRKLEWEFTVGVNRILKSGFTPRVILYLDALHDPNVIPAEEFEAMRRSTAITVSSQPGCDMHMHKTGFPTGGLYRCCMTSGATAVRWCFWLGFERVIGLGMGGVPVGAKTHFYGATTSRNSPDTRFRGYQKGLDRIRDDFGSAFQSLDALP